MQLCKGTYYILVVEHTGTKELVGCATLLVEQKFIHSAGTVSAHTPSSIGAIGGGCFCVV